MPYFKRLSKIAESLIADYSIFAAEKVGRNKFIESWVNLGEGITKSLDIYGENLLDNLSSALSSGTDTKTVFEEIGVNDVIFETFSEYAKVRKLSAADAKKALYALPESKYAELLEGKTTKTKHNGSSKENDRIIRDYIEKIAVTVGAEIKPFEEVRNEWLKREKPKVEIFSDGEFIFTKGRLSEDSKYAVEAAKPRIIEALNAGEMSLEIDMTH